MTELRIGTSGWMYKDWGATFYPPDMKKGFLTFLAQEFNTVEVNSSFYHLPRSSTFTKWHGEVPDDFIFAVKMSRFMTHQKKLVESAEPIERFLTAARELKEKLGPLLIQLPPSLQYDQELFKNFLSDLQAVQKKLHLKQLRFALEPRHKTWIAEENADMVRKLLTNQNIAIVFPHSAKIPSFKPIDENITADFVYIRFHGPSEFAASEYGSRRLSPWAKRIKDWQQKNLDVFVYFNNDIHGHAIKDARVLKRLVSPCVQG